MYTKRNNQSGVAMHICNPKTKEAKVSQALVAHAYNPSHSGGRGQEDHGLKPAQANVSKRLCLKKKKAII
jgi:hypothetical protein